MRSPRTALEYTHVSVTIDRDAGQVDITVRGPQDDPPADVAGIHAQGADFYPMALARELDDAILRLRTNELEAGTWVIRTVGDSAKVLAYAELVGANLDDWYVNEVRHFNKRVFKRLDVTSRSLIALVEPGSCFAGPLLELLLACDRQYMLDGTFTDADDADSQVAPTLIVSDVNFGAFPMSNGLTRLQSRFYGDDAGPGRRRGREG